MERTGCGDSSHTADGKYVVASFRADSNLSWVIDLRSFLNLPELKYRDYAPLERKHQVAANPPLYRNMIRGLSQAEVTIIDIESYKWEAYFHYTDRGATFGEDFDLRTIHNSAADETIRDSPLGLQHSESYYPRYDITSDGSWGLQELPQFDPSEVRRRGGNKLKDAVVISARAHSMLSPTEFYELRIIVERPYMRGSLADNMTRISKLGHVFDHEHAKSVPILNELVGTVAEASGIPQHVARMLSRKEPVKEDSSVASDHLRSRVVRRTVDHHRL
jgi:hypothetical protein